MILITPVRVPAAVPLTGRQSAISPSPGKAAAVGADLAALRICLLVESPTAQTEPAWLVRFLPSPRGAGHL